jgi:hypothetical protein
MKLKLTGDLGQRFAVRQFMEDGTTKDVGWTDNLPEAIPLRQQAELEPGCKTAAIVDRQTDLFKIV